MLSVFTKRCGCDFDSVYAILILAGWGGTRLCAIPLNDIVCIANIELGGRGAHETQDPPQSGSVCIAIMFSYSIFIPSTVKRYQHYCKTTTATIPIKRVPATFFSVEVEGPGARRTALRRTQGVIATSKRWQKACHEVTAFSVRSVTVSVTFSVRNPRVLHSQR